MKYYENYLVDVTLTRAVDGKKTDSRRWETRTLFDSHVDSKVRCLDHR